MSKPDAPEIVTDRWPEPVSRESIMRLLPAGINRALPDVLPRQRWYGEKNRRLASVDTHVLAVIDVATGWITLSTATLRFTEGDPSVYFVPLVIGRDSSERDVACIEDAGGEQWFVSDAPTQAVFQEWLREAATSGASLDSPDGTLAWRTPGAPLSLSNERPRLLTGEQSNSNIAYGDAMLIKVMRRVQSGVNPDVELGRYLSQQAGLTSVPRLVADWSLNTPEGEASIGMAQAFVKGAEDGWSWLLEQLRTAGTDSDRQQTIRDAVGQLGQRTADVHVALASARQDGAISPEPVSAADVAVWRSSTRSLLNGLLPQVKALAPLVSDDATRELIQRFILAAPRLVADLAGYDEVVGLLKTRVHGDYHLGQTLRRDGDWTIIDFEGEPARSLEARRARSSPLKDVAGMIRSLAYATAFAGREHGAWTDPERSMEAAFLASYRTAVPDARIVPEADGAFFRALYPWIIDKAIYEIAYEINNRPEWLWAPIASLLDQIEQD